MLALAATGWFIAIALATYNVLRWRAARNAPTPCKCGKVRMPESEWLAHAGWTSNFLSHDGSHRGVTGATVMVHRHPSKRLDCGAMVP